MAFAIASKLVKVLPVIICGGSGTRVWPESREGLPKQFIPLIAPLSTFQMTVESPGDDLFETPIVFSSIDYRYLVRQQLKEIDRAANVVLEPVRRGSAAAVAVATELAVQLSADTVVAVLSADIVFADVGGFIECCRRAARAAGAGHIVTLGIKPTEPATAYAYIKTGKTLHERDVVLKAECFAEKPNAETAARYVSDNYLWNSGSYFVRADVMHLAFNAHAPAILEAATKALLGAKRDAEFLVLDEGQLARSPQTSIDRAVLEKTDNAAVVPADIGWSDIGTWKSIYQQLEQDQNGNCVQGHGIIMNGSNVYVRSNHHLTAVVGVNNATVVTTQDGVLMLDCAQGDAVKELVNILTTQRRREVRKHKRQCEPWGFYELIDQGERHRVNRILLRPSARFSLQDHSRRGKYWIVVGGAAEVTRNDATILIQENQSIYLPVGLIYGVANPGKIDLELIEVQTGDHPGKDDLFCFEDAL
jgi:mannose-1-phosphate guanylyltransferase / mannose-6-phosphate isomerase